jgi:hypothetical protein
LQIFRTGFESFLWFKFLTSSKNFSIQVQFKSTWTELRDEPIRRLQRFQISYLKLCSCVGLSCAQTELQSLAGLHQHNSNYQ